jgi:hypothetical protein
VRIDLRNDRDDESPLFAVYDQKTGLRIDYVFLADDKTGEIGRYERQGGEFVIDPATRRLKKIVETRAILIELRAGGRPRREVFADLKAEELKKARLFGGLGKAKAAVK